MADKGEQYPANDYYFAPMLKFETQTDDLEYGGNMLSYCNEEDEEAQIEEQLAQGVGPEELAIQHEEIIKTQQIETDYQRDDEEHEYLHDLLLIDPISTAQRLERYPEQHMLVPRKKLEGPVYIPPPIEPKTTPVKLEEGMVEGGEKKAVKVIAPFQCEECSICFRTKTILNNHRKRHDLKLPITKPSFICPMEGCEVHCDWHATLIDHVRQHHGRSDVFEQTLYFTDWESFEKWKGDLEAKTTSRFVRGTGRLKMSGKTSRYYCYFSNTFYRAANRGIRKKPTKKCEKSCTAYISVNDTFGKLKVNMCLKHIGHEKDIQLLPLSARDRMEIATLLMQGMTEEDVVQTLRANATPDNRKYYLQPYEVKNIVSKILKSQYQAEQITDMCQDETVRVKTEEVGDEDIPEENPSTQETQTVTESKTPLFVIKEEVIN